MTRLIAPPLEQSLLSGGGDGLRTDRRDRRPLAVDRILGLLSEIAKKGECSLTDLSTGLNVPKTSLLNLLPGLVESGYLERKDRSYVLGPASFTLAGIIQDGAYDPVNAAEPLMQRLALDTDKTVTLAVLAANQRMILHVAKAEPPDAMRFSVSVGTLSPVHTTAAGRVMLAFGPSVWSDDYLRSAQLQSRTTRTIIDRDQLAASAEQVKKRGYAITRGETYETVGAIAAPVFYDDVFSYALVAAGAVEKVLKQEEMLSHLVVKTAAEISNRMSLRKG